MAPATNPRIMGMPPAPTSQAVKSHPSAPKKLNTNAMLPARRGRSSKFPAVDANTSLSHPKEPIKVPRDDATAPLLPTQTVTSVKRGRPRKESRNSPPNFQPAPLNDLKWERITARSAASWRSHCLAENSRYELEHDSKSNDLLLSLLKESAPTSTSHQATLTQKAPLTEEAATAQKAAATRRAFAAWKSAAAANAMPVPTNTKKVGPTSKGKVGTRRYSRTGKL
ncbi:hypothetical protein PtB15_12B258 [Puccinia triticina]|nr:hypothetical protein PtB15_12B258 [Puccinia triticina]